jgi:hypothetical protein
MTPDPKGWERFSGDFDPTDLSGDGDPRPTARELFDSLSKDEQDAQYGPDIAEAVRTGKVRLEDLAKETRPGDPDSFIVPRSAKDLGLTDPDEE